MPSLHSALRPLAPLALALATTAGAQQRTHGHAWLNWFGDHALGGGNSLYVELSARRADLGATWQQQVVGLGLARRVVGSYRATVTLIGQRSFPYVDGAGGNRVDEVRPWVQLQGQRMLAGTSRSGWQWADRSRLELRWQRADVPFDVEGDWRNSWRVRRQDRVTRQFANGWYAGASQEWFVGALPWAGGRVVEQSRTSLLAGRPLSPTLRAEAGYMLQWLGRPGGAEEFNHTLVISFRSNAAFR